MIHIDSSFIQSKFSRRIFLLFVSATVLPVLVIALLSFNHVSKQLREQSHQQSHRVSKAIGMEMIRSLILASEELGDISRDLPAGKNPGSDETMNNTLANLKRNAAVSFISSSGTITSLMGNTGHAPALTEQQRRHLGLGKTVIHLRKNINGNIDILMLKLVDPEHSAHSILFSKVAREPLWEASNLLPNDASLIVLTPSNSVLFSEQAIHPSLLATIKPLLDTAISGEFRWGDEHQEQLASYWAAFTEEAFALSHLVVVVSQGEATVLAPIIGFRGIYVPALLLAMLLVSFFAAKQIRKKLAPLVTLRDATQRLAKGDFNSQVEITSDDELAQLGEAFNSMAGKLGQQFTSLSTMADIDRLILSSFDADYIVTTVLGHAGKLTPCLSAAIIELDEHKAGEGKLSVQSVENGGEVFEQYLQISSTDIQVLNDNPEYLLIKHTDNYLSFMETLIQKGTTTFLLFPLFIKQRLAAAIILAHKLEVVAEGVETEAHKELLQEWHCDELQGYLISKPLPADRFEALLEASTRSTETPARSRDSKASTG